MATSITAENRVPLNIGPANALARVAHLFYVSRRTAMTPEESKRYVAICYALGRARGMLGDVLNGAPDLERIKEVYDSTATSRIAEAIGSTELEFSPDWNEHFTDSEKWISTRGQSGMALR
jgi:hypothetical protein